MAQKNFKYPIIIGKGLRKGVFAGPSQFGGCADLYILWLDKDLKSGDKIKVDDVDGVEAVLTFKDKQSVKETIDVLTTILMKMEE